MGMSFGAVWLLEACHKEEGADALQLPSMGHPVHQGDHFEAAFRSESCDTVSNN